MKVETRLGQQAQQTYDELNHEKRRSIDDWLHCRHPQHLSANIVNYHKIPDTSYALLHTGIVVLLSQQRMSGRWHDDIMFITIEEIVDIDDAISAKYAGKETVEHNQPFWPWMWTKILNDADRLAFSGQIVSIGMTIMVASVALYGPWISDKLSVLIEEKVDKHPQCLLRYSPLRSNETP